MLTVGSENNPFDVSLVNNCVERVKKQRPAAEQLNIFIREALGATSSWNYCGNQIKALCSQSFQRPQNPAPSFFVSLPYFPQRQLAEVANCPCLPPSPSQFRPLESASPRRPHPSRQLSVNAPYMATLRPRKMKGTFSADYNEGRCERRQTNTHIALLQKDAIHLRPEIDCGIVGPQNATGMAASSAVVFQRQDP